VRGEHALLTAELKAKLIAIDPDSTGSLQVKRDLGAFVRSRRERCSPEGTLEARWSVA
jgi:hypothetical protein